MARAKGTKARRVARAASRGLTHRVVAGTRVLLVEPQGPLRVEDFVRLRSAARAMLKGRGRLDGVVVHVRKFPGWEDLDAFLEHVRFVRDHHRKVGRIALATNSRFARWVPRLARRLLDAEVRAFRYGGVGAAIAWAGSRKTSGRS